MKQTDPTAETARALLYRHGLPEDVVDGVLCLHAQELAAVQRREADDLHQTEPGVVKGLRIGADLIDPTKGPAAPAVVSPPTNRADLRKAVARAIHRYDNHHALSGNDVPSKHHYGEADAVLAVLGEQADRAAVLLWAANQIEAMRGYPSVMAPEDAVDELRRLAVEAHGTGTQQPSRCTCDHARAMHTGPNLFCAVPGCECAQYAEAQQQPDTEAPSLPDRLQAALTERFTELGNPFSEMRRHEKGPDGWPATHPVSPAKVAEVLRELLADEAAPVAQQPAAEAEDVCRPVEIDGEIIRVRGAAEMSDESRAALAEVIAAAKRRFLAEHPEVEQQAAAADGEEPQS